MADGAEERAWPALMDQRTAAAYLGVGVGTLRVLLRRLGVEPLTLGLRLRRWRRSDLDAVIAQLPLTRRTLFGDSCASAETGVDCALAAVERRASAPRRLKSH
jgi:hypothetical protein